MQVGQFSSVMILIKVPTHLNAGYLQLKPNL